MSNLLTEIKENREIFRSWQRSCPVRVIVKECIPFETLMWIYYAVGFFLCPCLNSFWLLCCFKWAKTTCKKGRLCICAVISWFTLLKGLCECKLTVVNVYCGINVFLWTNVYCAAPNAIFLFLTFSLAFLEEFHFFECTWLNLFKA